MHRLDVSDEQVAQYREKGYLVLEAAIDEALMTRIRAEVDATVARAAEVEVNDDVYDLEASHSREAPRVRRIKRPHSIMAAVDELVRLPAVGAAVARLFGTDVRLQTSKLNMKSAEFGAPVEWHQDWTFYPHTNDDLLAMGLLLDDCNEENGPLLVIPGSHRGPVYDHHADGRFCGAMDPTVCDADYDSAEALTGPAGSLTFHHVRAVHGSGLNRSDRSRRLLLTQYTAVDAWPLINPPSDIEAYDAQIVHGQATLFPRLANVPVKLPLPVASFEGSIYENQRTRANRYFGEHVGAERAERAERADAAD